VRCSPPLALAFGFSWQAASSRASAWRCPRPARPGLACRAQSSSPRATGVKPSPYCSSRRVGDPAARAPAAAQRFGNARRGWMDGRCEGFGGDAVVIISSRIVVRPVLRRWRATAARSFPRRRCARRRAHMKNRPVALARRFLARGAPAVRFRHELTDIVALQGPAARSFLHSCGHTRTRPRLGRPQIAVLGLVVLMLRNTDVPHPQDRRRAERHGAATCSFGFQGGSSPHSLRRGGAPRHIDAAPLSSRGGRDRFDAARAARFESHSVRSRAAAADQHTDVTHERSYKKRSRDPARTRIHRSVSSRRAECDYFHVAGVPSRALLTLQ